MHHHHHQHQQQQQQHEHQSALSITTTTQCHCHCHHHHHHHHHHLFAKRRYNKTSEVNSTRRNNTHLQNAIKYTITQVHFIKCLYNIDCIKKIGKITNIATSDTKLITREYDPALTLAINKTSVLTLRS